MTQAFLSASYKQANFSAFDAKMMALALRLAEKGRFSTTPNPHVGCVLVDQQGEIVGQGFHEKAGEGHAEVIALSMAGAKAKRSIAYVTLEPCAHTGRTGPCAEALVAAEVAKVIIACVDPNPQVAGKGIKILMEAGIEVQCGLMQAQAEHLNRYFFYRMLNNKPFVSVKLASSLDGKTALENGESKWITGPEARRDVQVQRASACAILSGTDTVIADDPSLNVRLEELPKAIAECFSFRQQQPLRVLIDSKNRLCSEQYQMLKDGNACLVYNLLHNNKLLGSHIMQKQVQKSSHKNQQYVDLHQVLNDLSSQGINHLWVEAGARLTGALFDAGLVNELIVYQAPMLLGKPSRNMTNAQSPNLLAQAIKGNFSDMRKIGKDIKIVMQIEN